MMYEAFQNNEKMRAKNPQRWRKPQLLDRRAFTLIELLVTMAIIAIIATVTLVSVRTVTEEAKISSAKNTLSAVLDNARALAMKENTIVMVVFRAKLVNDRTQVIEAVTAKYSGSTYVNRGLIGSGLVDRFVPIPEVPARDFPTGITLAGPHYKSNQDELWLATSNMVALRTGEMAGAIIAVIYGPDGATRTDNPRTDSIESWVDFDNNTSQHQRGTEYFPTNVNLNDPNNTLCDFGDVIEANGSRTPINAYYTQNTERDEPYVVPVRFLTVFNDADCRELYDTTTWDDGPTRIADQSEYINNSADRIHFNRYTGVVMK